MDSQENPDIEMRMRSTGTFVSPPLEKLECLIRNIDNFHAALPELVALRNGIEEIYRHNIRLCVRVAMKEFVARPGSEDPVSKVDRAKDATDVEALEEIITKLQSQVGELIDPSGHRDLLGQKEELESDLRLERAKVQAKEDTIVDSVRIREGLERDLVQLREDVDAANTTHHELLRASKANLEEVQTSLDRAAKKYADLDREHRNVTQELEHHRSGTAKWHENIALKDRVGALHAEKLKLENETTKLRYQLKKLQIDHNNSASIAAQRVDSELEKLRTTKSAAEKEVATLKKTIRDLDKNFSDAVKFGQESVAKVDQLEKKNEKWKKHANVLKGFLDDKEGELEIAQSEKRKLFQELQQIHKRAKQDADMFSRRFPTLGRENLGDTKEEGGEEAEEEEHDEEDDHDGRPVLEGYKQPAYNIVLGNRGVAGGPPRPRASQPNMSQDVSDVPDVALRPKSRDPVPPGYSVVKEHLRKISNRSSRVNSVTSGNAADA